MGRHASGSRSLTELELQIMNAIWAHENRFLSIEDIRQMLGDDGRILSPSSIRTIMHILEQKNFVNRRAEGRRNLFEAAVPREQAQEDIALEVLDGAFGGSASDLVAALLGSGKLKSEDLLAVRNHLEKALQEARR
jgi:BlaI family transcriptional regulator, penicillinase repressor